MILFTFGERTEEKIAFPDIGRRSWRWTVETGINRHGVTLFSLHQQVLFPNSSWQYGISCLSISIAGSFKFGRDCFWYDGKHNIYDIGFLHLYWREICLF